MALRISKPIGGGQCNTKSAGQKSTQKRPLLGAVHFGKALHPNVTLALDHHRDLGANRIHLQLATIRVEKRYCRCKVSGAAKIERIPERRQSGCDMLSERRQPAGLTGIACRSRHTLQSSRSTDCSHKFRMQKLDSAAFCSPTTRVILLFYRLQHCDHNISILRPRHLPVQFVVEAGDGSDKHNARVSNTDVATRAAGYLH